MFPHPTRPRWVSVLEHVERRRILAELAKTPDPVEVPLDREVPVGESVETEIRFDVLHYHLPELAARGYVRFDEDARVVTRGPRFPEIRPLLGVTNGHRRTAVSPWQDG